MGFDLDEATVSQVRSLRQLAPLGTPVRLFTEPLASSLVGVVGPDDSRERATRPSATPTAPTVVPTVRTEDLIDAHDVADIVGLSDRNSVRTYLRRYDDFPRPVVERSQGRTRLWLRKDVIAWQRSRR